MQTTQHLNAALLLLGSLLATLCGLVQADDLVSVYQLALDQTRNTRQPWKPTRQHLR